MSAGVNATYLACHDAKAQCIHVAAEILQRKPEDLEYREGKVVEKASPNHSVSLGEIAGFAAHGKKESAMIVARGIDERPTEYTLGADHHSHYGHSVGATYYDTLTVEVEVDEKTGKLRILEVIVADDCGKVIDRLMLEGQVDGAVMQGLGAALMEERRIDETGSLANPNFDRYRIPRTVDVPEIKKIFIESNEPSYCYGQKGGGESPGIGTIMPAIANAIYDAVGVRVRSTPITPKKIMEALAVKDAGGGREAE